MTYTVDFVNVSTVGLESSPVADALAGLRANEARYFKNKYDHVFKVEPAAKAKKALARVNRVLEDERDIVIASPPLEVSDFQVENIRWTYVFYESVASRSMCCTHSTSRRSGRSGSSSRKAWRFRPSSGRSSSRGRNRSWPGRSAGPIS